MSPNPTSLLPRYSAVCRAVGPLRLQSKMRTIIVKLPSEANFSSEMAAMRVWLDKHRCAPSMFKYHLAQESVIIQVEFDKDEEAEVFKRYFDGRETI